MQKILGKYFTVGRGCFYSANGVCALKKFASRNLYIGYFFGELVIFDHYHFAKCLILFVKSTPHPSRKNKFFLKNFFFSKKKLGNLSPSSLFIIIAVLLVCSTAHVGFEPCCTQYLCVGLCTYFLYVHALSCIVAWVPKLVCFACPVLAKAHCF